MPEIGTGGKRPWRGLRISHGDLLSSNRPGSAYRAERSVANFLRTGGLLPFPRIGSVLVRDASVIRSIQQVKGRGQLGSDKRRPGEGFAVATSVITRRPSSSIFRGRRSDVTRNCWRTLCDERF